MRKTAISFVLSVRKYKIGSHWTDFRKTWNWKLLRKSLEKIEISLKSNKNIGTLHEDLRIFCSYRRNNSTIEALSSSEIVPGC